MEQGAAPCGAGGTRNSFQEQPAVPHFSFPLLDKKFQVKSQQSSEITCKSHVPGCALLPAHYLFLCFSVIVEEGWKGLISTFFGIRKDHDHRTMDGLGWKGP